MNRWFDNIPFLKGKVPGKIVLSTLLLIYSFLVFGICVILGKFRLDRVLICIAMLFSFGGDVMLNGVSLQKRTKKRFIGGAIFFAFAHLVYVCAYSYLIKLKGFIVKSIAFYVVWFIVILFILIPFILKILSKHRRMKLFDLFGIGYLFFVTLNCATAISYFSSVRGYTFLAAIGSISFFISDILIGIETFLEIKS